MPTLYRNTLRALVGLLTIGSLLTLEACQDHRLAPDPNTLPDRMIYALNDANQLLRLNIRSSNSPLATTTITGMNPGERILAIDFRPATGQLYGVSNQSRMFVINPMTAAARPLTPANASLGISGGIVGLDFNPTVDRIRLVTNTGQNLRLNPETGLVAATDGVINGVMGAMISEAAYTNNRAGTMSTTLYDIDPATDRLYIQNPPNNGTLTNGLPLGLDITGAAGFDIASDDNTQGLVAVTFNGASELQQINLSTGRLQKLGNLPGSIIGLAIPTELVGYAIDGANNLLVFNPDNPIPLSKTVAGLQAGETLQGIDQRPLNGQLYALGSSSRLYTIAVTATSSWSAVQVGSAGAFTLSGSNFGFDFNPTVDRIRIVSNTGQNLRMIPDNATLVGGVPDGMLNYAPGISGTPNVSGAAYTNNFVGAPSTILYDIDVRSGSAVLLQQNPPNMGTLINLMTGVGSLGVEVEAANGFDIGGMTNRAYAILRVSGVTRVYVINLDTGFAANGSMLPGNPTIRGLAIGLGF